MFISTIFATIMLETDFNVLVDDIIQSKKK